MWYLGSSLRTLGAINTRSHWWYEAWEFVVPCWTPTCVLCCTCQLFHVAIMMSTLRQADAVFIDYKTRREAILLQPQPTLSSACGPIASVISAELVCILYFYYHTKQKLDKIKWADVPPYSEHPALYTASQIIVSLFLAINLSSLCQFIEFVSEMFSMKFTSCVTSHCMSVDVFGIKQQSVVMQDLERQWAECACTGLVLWLLCSWCEMMSVSSMYNSCSHHWWHMLTVCKH